MNRTTTFEQDAAGALKKGSRNVDQTIGDAAASLAAGFQDVVTNAEELLKATTNYSAEGFASAREQFQKKLETAKVTLADARLAVNDKAEQAAAVTEKYVTDNPWKALAITGSLGVILGMLLSRR